MPHLVILFRILTILCGSIIGFYFYNYGKKHNINLFKPLFLYTLFFNLFVINELFFKYFYVNIAGFPPEGTVSIGDFFRTFLGFIFSTGLMFSFFKITDALTGKSFEIKFRSYIFLVVGLLSGMYIAGCVDYFNSNSIAVLVSAGWVKHFIYSGIIISLMVFIIRFDNQQIDKLKFGATNKLGWYLFFCYLVLFSISFIPIDRNFLVSVTKFLINLVPILWFHKFKMEQEIVKEVSTGELTKKLVKEYELSEREFEILDLLVEGKNNSEMAEQLFISQNTVKNHIANIYKKLGVNNRTKLVNMIFNTQGSIN